MEDGTEHEPGAPGADTAPDERADRPISFDFKLRLGTRESTAALAGRATGELVQLQPIDWDSFAGLKAEREPQQYKTDGDLPSIIVELANQIAKPGETPLIDETAARPAGAAPEVLIRPRPIDPAAAVIAPVAAPTPATEPEARPEAVAASGPTVVEPAPADVTPVGEAAEPIEVPAIVEQEPPLPSSELAAIIPGAEPAPAPSPSLAPDVASAEATPAPSAAEAEEAAAPPAAVAAAVPVAATPQLKLLTGAEAMAAAAVSAPPAPAPPVLQLAKIERRPDAGRPTKPVDFHALLGQAGLQPAAVKKRKKRHPFRFLFKLAIVVGLLGAGAFYGKKYVLDMRWDGDVKGFAEEVADTRQLSWKKAVKVEELSLADYAAHITGSVLGPDAATDPRSLESEWRAMGLLEGELDLQGVGAFAAAWRPVYYDPVDGMIYELERADKSLHEFYLYAALTEALLDQHFHWSDQIAELDRAAATGWRALVDGDAEATAQEILGLDGVERAELFLTVDEVLVDLASDIGPMRGYPVDLVAGGGFVTAATFGESSFPDVEARNELIADGVASDAAAFDGTRKLSDNPTSIGTGDDQAGMMYWYYVLAGRLPDAEAWDAALAWDGDRTTFEAVSDGRCVTATISTVDAAGQGVLLDALTRWAAAGPAESLATAAAEGTERIEVRSCDPGVSADGLADDDVIPWGDASVELAGAALFELDSEQDSRVCMVNAVRFYGVADQVFAGAADADDTLVDIAQSCADV